MAKDGIGELNGKQGKVLEGDLMEFVIVGLVCTLFKAVSNALC